MTVRSATAQDFGDLGDDRIVRGRRRFGLGRTAIPRPHPRDVGGQDQRGHPGLDLGGPRYRGNVGADGLARFDALNLLRVHSASGSMSDSAGRRTSL